MSNLPKTNNLEELTNMGYDVSLSKKYLDISDNNLEKALELLLSNNKLNADIDVDTNVLTSVINNSNYKSDKSNSIKESLKKYTDDKELIEKILQETQGDYQHSKLLLQKDNPLTDSDTDSRTD
jgi:uncharacterized protein YpiB (UPF0302 family)|tara:strand:+ start:724 stop:1095 length:372 start_codon:yes stop_codon:yes gene_type:complete